MKARWSSLVAMICGLMCVQAHASDAYVHTLSDEFKALYQNQFGQVSPCRSTRLERISVCSAHLRNEGNAPFILHHGQPTDQTIILTHGLSYSPFFLRSVATLLHREGATVIVPLLPAHGLRELDGEMTDSALSAQWQAHLSDVRTLVADWPGQLYLGGFSAGATLSVSEYLHNREGIDGLILFSAALQMTNNVEQLSRIWGIGLVAKLLDSDYQAHGPNPYKYPEIASSAGLELIEVIRQIRAEFERGSSINVPVFAAHSQADALTPIEGIYELLNHASQAQTFFEIDESYSVCHADVVLDRALIAKMKLPAMQLNPLDKCEKPKANPQFDTMMIMLQSYLNPPRRQ